MRWKSVLGLVAVLPVGSGCNLAYYAGHNLVNEPIARADEHKLSGRIRAEAHAAWRCVRRQEPNRTFTPEFADGFLDGYADLLEVGGNPAPPAVPPVRYRRADSLTPAGQALTREYLLGAQCGAEAAAASGRRQTLTVPVLLAAPAADAPDFVTPYTAPPVGPAAPGVVAPPPPPEIDSSALPLPRPFVPTLPKVEVPVPTQPPPPPGRLLQPVNTPATSPDVPLDWAIPEVAPPEHRPPATLPPAPRPLGGP